MSSSPVVVSGNSSPQSQTQPSNDGVHDTAAKVRKIHIRQLPIEEVSKDFPRNVSERFKKFELGCKIFIAALIILTIVLVCLRLFNII